MLRDLHFVDVTTQCRTLNCPRLIHSVDGQHPAPPEKPWNDGSPDKQWFPMISSIHIANAAAKKAKGHVYQQPGLRLEVALLYTPR